MTSDNDHGSPSVVQLIIWKSVHGVMATFFLLCAIAQVNDPDPFIWMTLYIVPAMLGIVAIVSASITDNPVYKWLVVIHIGACIVGMAYSVASIGQFTDNPMKKEEGREFTGLLIVTVWLTFCRFNWINNGSNTKPIQMSVILTIAVVMCVMPMAAWSVCLIVESPSSPYHCADHRDVMQD